MVDKDKVIQVLKEVYDPEIPINVYDLGLIYQIEVEEKSVRILMTFTSPSCPTGDYIVSMVEEAVSAISGVEEVDVEVTFDPPWTPSMVSDAAKEDLGITEDGEVSPGENFSSMEEDKMCFNCSATENDLPLMTGRYKGENVFICNRCINKF